MRPGFALPAVVGFACLLAGCGSQETGIRVIPRRFAARIVAGQPVFGPGEGPARAVEALLASVDLGDRAVIAAAYAPAVVRTLGVTGVVAGWERQRPLLLATYPSVVAAEVIGDYGYVALRLFPLAKSATPRFDDFQLVHLPGGWRVAFDSLLEAGLRGYDDAQATPRKPSLTERFTRASLQSLRPALR